MYLREKCTCEDYIRITRDIKERNRRLQSKSLEDNEFLVSGGLRFFLFFFKIKLYM